MPKVKKKRKNPSVEVYKKYKPLDKGTYSPPKVFRRSDNREYSSLSTMVCDTSRKDTHRYTGDKLLGIATMHKSNAVPVFKGQDAIDIAKMRRG